jgi:putrescine aminotransferase
MPELAKATRDALRASDRAHHIHPYTDHAELHAAGTHLITEAEGCWITDAEGRRFLDGLAGLWCVNVGYGSKKIADAVNEQIRRLPFYPSFFNSSNEPAIRLAERLAQIAPPGVNHALFSGSGSEANETALKIVRSVQKMRGQPRRTKILTRHFAYHGVTLATTSMTGLPACQDPFDLPIPGFLHAPAPHPYAANSDLDRIAYGNWCIDETRRLIEAEGPETIAAMFVEPVQGAGGVIVPPDGYLHDLRELTRSFGILFVADEVITGFGRLGDWFASSLWSLEPDLITLAKGLTSGYLPMGATLLCDELSEELTSGGYFAHGHTYSGHPTCAAAALANLEEIEERGLIPYVRDEIGPSFVAGLAQFESHPAVAEVRATGLIGAIELVDDDTSVGARAADIAREQGVIVRGLKTAIAMAPPLVISADEIDTLFTAIGETLDRL